VHHLDLSTIVDLVAGETPILWVGALGVVIVGAIFAAFTFYLLLLLPFTLASGEIGANARAVFRDLLRLFHNLLDVVKHLGSLR
jgi:hypothetical protein